MSKILITGASGFIGSNFFEYLKKIQHCCEGYSRSSINTAFKKVDDYCALTKDDTGNELVIHLAGSNSPEAIDDINKEFETVQALSNYFKNRLIYISSAKVYMRKNNKILKETDSTTTCNKYNTLKLMCESEVIKNNGMVLRLSNIYGKGMSRSNVFSHIKQQLIENKNEIFLKRPDDIGDFIHINDLSIALYQSSISPTCSIFNVGSGLGVSIRELCKIIAQQLGIKDIKILSTSKNYQPMSAVLCCDLFRKYYNWKPNIKLDQGIKNWIQ